MRVRPWRQPRGRSGRGRVCWRWPPWKAHALTSPRRRTGRPLTRGVTNRQRLLQVKLCECNNLLWLIFLHSLSRNKWNEDATGGMNVGYCWARLISSLSSPGETHVRPWIRLHVYSRFTCFLSILYWDIYVPFPPRKESDDAAQKVVDDNGALSN